MSSGAAGRLFGVGVGPGDPELVTLKAQRIIGACDVVAYPEKRAGSSIARQAAAPWIAPGLRGARAGLSRHDRRDRPPAGLRGRAAGLLRRVGRADRRACSTRGRDVAVLCEGDPFFYGSYMYLHERLADRYATEVVPGVTAFSAAAAAAGTPLAKRDDVLVVAPGTLPRRRLAAHLRDADAAVVMKLGRRFDGVRDAAALTPASASAASTSSAHRCDDERVAALDDVTGEVPYMSLVLVPTRAARRAAPPAAPARGDGTRHARGRRARPGGPGLAHARGRRRAGGGRRARRLRPVSGPRPARAGQRRHASDNRVEMDRARHALELAAAGSSVAVVSSGDPGIFAMATAVLEAVESGNGAVRRHRPARRAGPVGDACRRSARRRSAGPRLRGDLAVGPAQAVGDHRAPAGGRRRGRPRARALQPGVAHAPRAARARARGAAAPPLARTARSSSRATSAAPASPSRCRRSAASTPSRSTCARCSSSARRRRASSRGAGGRTLVYTPRSYPT